MTEQRARRHLAASLAADVADYSHHVNGHEAGKTAARQAVRPDGIEPTPEARGRRLIKHTNRGFFAELTWIEAALPQVPRALEAHTDA